jgi:hypothetical protein
MLTVDRIETTPNGKIAVIENSIEDNIDYINVPLTDLPENVREGDVIIFENGENGANGAYRIDTETTSKQRNILKSRELALRARKK